ncbi:hypothetical protein ADICYQ_3751 [Cyclobacterium qasimii M12-11B]|uniref:Uncharacterized protein n=1 Tax=Cyclobacterium qasimii M12-11B TaxID=641524 RepID=S7VB46_9BACT|nr:hypothetical protein ADICYQ_3751 [Cyclobacterium qasimii M12-11B]
MTCFNRLSEANKREMAFMKYSLSRYLKNNFLFFSHQNTT